MEKKNTHVLHGQQGIQTIFPPLLDSQSKKMGDRSFPSKRKHTINISISQFSPWTITQSSISSLNYENDRFGPQTFAFGSISSLNYENSHFGPQTFASDSNSSLAGTKYPFYPSPTPTHRLLLAAREPVAPSAPYYRCRLRERLAPQVSWPAATQNPPQHHLLLHRQAQILGAAMTKAGHGWGVGALGEGGTRP
jgi:hypothetical protein